MEVGLAVGGAFLSSALNVFFDRMTPKFPDLFHGRKGDDQLLRKLKRILFVIEVMLDDAEEKQNINTHVKKWLRELKDTVYHAEDFIDEINTEAQRLETEDGEQSVTNTVSHCEKLTRCKRSWDLHKLVALRHFTIGDDNEDFCLDEWLLPCSLKLLRFDGCKELEKLNQKVFCRLTSLETLQIYSCTGLLSLPLVGLPGTLSTLSVSNCPLLKPHLKREKGKYWSTIAHISNIPLITWSSD